MGLLDDLRVRGAASRVTEEALYAEALREVESGQRRDGLWAKAMADSAMDIQRAQALYLKLRVRSLRDEIAVLQRLLAQVSPDTPQVQQPAAQPLKTTPNRLAKLGKWFDYQLNGTSDLGNSFAKWLGLLLLTLVVIVFASIFFSK